MQQVRYFLAVARTRNFTRAAEECNVTQPSLTRAIKQLEAELGGDLFRRERPAAQLTDLGERVLPLLKQCYESALDARSLATSVKSGEIGSLRLAMSHTVDLEILVPHLRELQRVFNRLDCRVLRGTGQEVEGLLKSGDAELGITSSHGEAWDRLDAWPLFTEGFVLLVHAEHPLAARESVSLEDLRDERVLVRTHCEHADQFSTLIAASGIDTEYCYKVSSERDLVALVAAGQGVAIVPRSISTPETLRRVPINDLELNRLVHLYGVAGRQRTAAANAILKMLRSADWPHR
jgi:DNA-binding transcriptional LysR family regulator